MQLCYNKGDVFYYSLKVEAIGSSEMLETTSKITRRHNQPNSGHP
jgi:hypothetical protein